jgi:hypothetical protein
MTANIRPAALDHLASICSTIGSYLARRGPSAAALATDSMSDDVPNLVARAERVIVPIHTAS